MRLAGVCTAMGTLVKTARLPRPGVYFEVYQRRFFRDVTEIHCDNGVF
jgi:hypothetical protein